MIFAEQDRLSRQEEGHQQRRGGGRGPSVWEGAEVGGGGNEGENDEIPKVAKPSRDLCFTLWEDPLEEGMVTLSSILAWRIPCTEEPGGLQSKGSQRVRPD